MDKDTQRRAKRIGGEGEYTVVATIRQEERNRFLDHLIKREPRILTDLAAHVWPSFNTILADDLIVLLENDDTETEKAFRAWATTWGFVDSWCLIQAVATLWRWHYQGHPTPDCGWGIHEVVMWPPLVTDEERMFGFEHPGWEVVTQTWPDFEDELDREYAEWKAA